MTTSLGLARAISQMAEHDVPMVTITAAELKAYIDGDSLPDELEAEFVDTVEEVGAVPAEEEPTRFILIKVVQDQNPES